MPANNRPVRATRNIKVNYAESVCSAASDNDSEYFPEDYVVEKSSGSVGSEEVRRSPRLIEKNSRKNRRVSKH